MDITIINQKLAAKEKSAKEAAEQASKFLRVLKSLDETCKTEGFADYTDFLTQISGFEKDGAGPTASNKSKAEDTSGKRKKGKRTVMTQKLVDAMKAMDVDGKTAKEISSELGVSAPTVAVYRGKKFKFNPKPKGRAKSAPAPEVTPVA